MKEYKIKFLNSDAFRTLVIVAIAFVYFAYKTLKEYGSFLPTLIPFGIVMIVFSFAYLYFSKLKIYINDDHLIVKVPDKTTKVTFRNIYKVEKTYGWGSSSYYLFYRDENNKKRKVGIPDDLENCQELLAYISKKSGTQARHEMFSFEKNTNIFKKILRIILFFLIYLLLFGVPIWATFFRK